MRHEYKSGTFCMDIQCPHHKVLEAVAWDEYLAKKRDHCKDCYAWKFFLWLKEKDWRILRPIPDISSKELAARLKGLDPVKVEHLTEDEILCL
ncbi:MAG: hypothetical protein AB1640_12240 [bacterium]